MEEGSLRCDANVSIRPAGSDELGTKTELKNMNSFRFLERGHQRRDRAPDGDPRGGRRRSSRRRCTSTPSRGAISSLRSKEEAHDYRYFPEPDLVPVVVDEAMLDGRARASCPSCRPQRAERYERELGLTADSARLLAFRAELRRLLRAALAAPTASTRRRSRTGSPASCVARIGDGDPARSKVAPAALAQLVALAARQAA